MEKEKKREEKEEELEGIAGGVLKGIGNMIPGLGGLIKGLEKSPAFKERLKKIDEEVERKLKEEPLKKVGEEGSLHIRREFGVRPPAKGRTAVRKETPPPTPQERPADVFDEKDHIKIIAEIPGVDENDIKVDLQDDTLVISIDISDRKYHQELKLPCEPKGMLEKTYRNGILEVKIKKE